MASRSDVFALSRWSDNKLVTTKTTTNALRGYSLTRSSRDCLDNRRNRDGRALAPVDTFLKQTSYGATVGPGIGESEFTWLKICSKSGATVLVLRVHKYCGTIVVSELYNGDSRTASVEAADRNRLWSRKCYRCQNEWFEKFSGSRAADRV